jgi:hypothetical protein
MEKLYSQVLERTKKFIDGLGGVDRASDHLKGSRSTIYKVFGVGVSGPQLPKTEMVFAWLEAMGAKIVWPEDVGGGRARDVCIINPKQVAVIEQVQPPESDDYMAVPLAEAPIAAGPGLLGEDAIRGWVIVWRHHDAIRFRTDLVAVEIGRGQTSMVPLLHPGDIVLVDRSERNPDPDGKIMLVCDPDGGCAIKRVSSRRIDGDTELVFYSDNAPGNPPQVNRLKRDFGGNLHAAIGGRVVWAWSDMTRK